MPPKLNGPMRSGLAYALTEYSGSGEELIEHIGDFQKMGNIPQNLNFSLIHDRMALDFDSAKLRLPHHFIHLAKSIRVYNSEMRKVDAIDLRYALSLENPDVIHASSFDETKRARVNKETALLLRDALVLTKGDLLGSIVLYGGKYGSAQRYSINRGGDKR